MAERSDETIRRIAYDLYTSRDLSVSDYVADASRREGLSPAEAFAEDLLDPAASELKIDEWDERDLRRLRRALIDLGEADLEATGLA